MLIREPKSTSCEPHDSSKVYRPIRFLFQKRRRVPSVITSPKKEKDVSWDEEGRGGLCQTKKKKKPFQRIDVERISPRFIGLLLANRRLYRFPEKEVLFRAVRLWLRWLKLETVDDYSDERGMEKLEWGEMQFYGFSKFEI